MSREPDDLERLEALEPVANNPERLEAGTARRFNPRLNEHLTPILNRWAVPTSKRALK